MGRRFVDQRRRDPYYRAAQREGLRSRAAYKLEFLASRFPLFRRGDRVLDLGAAPGGWSLVALDHVGRGGHVVAVDPRSIEPAPGVEVVRGSVGSPQLRERLRGRSFDVVLSDMSPAISGAYATDHARSVSLAKSAFALARDLLSEGGTFAAKVFDGDLLAGLEAELAPAFGRFVRTKPPASRSSSSELYLLGFGFHRPPAGPAA